MNYGLYLSASGVLTNMYRQDVFANNLANVETVAFKPDMPQLQQRDPASVETHASGDVSRRLLDQLGGGVLAGPQQIDFAPGTLKPTSNSMDVALDAPDTFLVVQPKVRGKGSSTPGSSPVRLTRDGRLGHDAEGFLTTATSGDRVLGQGDQPIQLTGQGPVTIDGGGHVSQSGQVVGQLQVTAVSDKSLLRKEGRGLFGWQTKGDIRKEATNASVRPGYVETSGVDPVRALMDLIKTTNAIERDTTMIHYHDTMMDRAINSLGRVA